MKNNIDVLLINSIAPRQRIVSDTGLENGLAVIRTYLEEQGFGVEVIDEQRVSGVEQGVPRWCLWLLRLLAKLQLKAHESESRAFGALLCRISRPIQQLALYYRRQRLESTIDNIVKLIKRYNIPMIGIKLWYGEAFQWSLLLSARIKASCPDTVIIAGGPQVKVYGEHILAWKEYFDLAIMGPGEKILGDLLVIRKHANSKQEFLQKVFDEINSSLLIKTSGYREGCAAADYQSGRIAKYRPVDVQDKILFHTLADGYGCTWNKCNFCTHPRQMHYQPRPIDEIISEMKEMLQHGVAFFRFSSSETPVDQGSKIAQAILDVNLKVNYSMFKRPGKVTPETYEAYRLMIQSGLRAVFMGGETGHDLINEKVMNKGAVKKDIVDTIHCIQSASAEAGQSCRIALSLIYPCPTTDGIILQDVYERNIALIREAQPDTVIVNPPVVFPATQWFDCADKFGFHIGEKYIYKLMQYEYSIYKPVELWDKLDYSLADMDNFAILRETGRLRKAVADMGIPTDISDELLMMTGAVGYSSKADLLRFKQQSLLDIMTGSAKYADELVRKINHKSREVASLNFTS